MIASMRMVTMSGDNLADLDRWGTTWNDTSPGGSGGIIIMPRAAAALEKDKL
jgi:hypothetical protein